MSLPYPVENNSPVYWDLQQSDGTWFSLHTRAWSVKSFSGRRFFAGAKRGEDLQLPFRRGRIYVPKTREAQLLELNMWVLPTREDGTRDPNKTEEQKAHENWRKIVAAVDQEGQFQLRKRWYSDTSTRNTFKTDIQTATGIAEFIDGSGPDSDDGKGFYMNLSLVLADPYFYTNTSIETFESELGSSIVLEGEALSDHLCVEFTNSGATDPKLIFPDGNWVQFLSSDAGAFANSSITIDCRKGLAMVSTLDDYLAGTPTTSTYVNGLIRRNPEIPYWPAIDPVWGNLSSMSLTGTADVRLYYDAAYR